MSKVKGIIKTLNKGFFQWYAFIRLLWLENPYSIVIFGIMILAIILRTYNLSALPSGISESEFLIIQKSKTIADAGKLWLGTDFKEGAYIYLIALIIKLFGVNIYFFRILSALLGVLTVFLVYLFTKEWFNKQTAFIAGLFLSFSAWHITISRNINPAVLKPLFIILILYFASFAFRTRKIRYVILSALFLGLSIYVGIEFFVLPILLLLSALYFYIRNHKFLLAYIKEISIAFNIFLLVVFPYLFTMAKSGRIFFLEYKFISSDILINLGSVVSSLFSYADSNYYFNLGTEAFLDPLLGVLFFIGIIFILFNIKSRKNFFLLIWIILMIIPAIFSYPHYQDKIVMVLPAVIILAAVVLDHLFNEWFTTFPFNKKARIFMVVLSLVFFALAFTYNYKRYFIAWANSEGIKKVYNANILMIK